MRKIFQKSYFPILCLCLLACRQEPVYNGYTIRELKGGHWADDDTYIYDIPFEKGKKVFLAQAYHSNFSHKNELSLDFKVKVGTEIFAAREGVVVGRKGDSKIGGLKNDYLDDGNYVLIQHDDGSFGGYWHLQYNGALVEVGDNIAKGQLIGRSGNTGYSAFPHLHFWVYKMEGGEKVTIPTRFQTDKGVRYLRPSRRYAKPE